MNVEERILMERITTLAQLGEDERRIVECDERLLALIADNALLAEMAEVHAPEPQRERMFAAIDAAGNTKETEQMGILKLLNGRSWKFQLAIIGLLAVGLFTVSQLLPGRDLVPGATPAWASSDGYTLVYELGNSGGFSTSESGLSEAIDNWRQETGNAAEDMALRVHSNNGETRVALTVEQVDEAQLDRLVELIAVHSGMLDPQVTGTTMFQNAGYGVGDVMFGNPLDNHFVHEAPLERVAGLFAGEDIQRTHSAFVHGGGGPIFVGRFSTDDNQAHGFAESMLPGRVTSVAAGECQAYGAVSLFGGQPSAGGPSALAFSGGGTGTAGGPSALFCEDEDLTSMWTESVASAGSGPSAGGTATAPKAGGSRAIAWVSGETAPSAWFVEGEQGALAWTPAAPSADGASNDNVFALAPRPSHFIVLEDSQESVASFPQPAGAGTASGYTVWAPPAGGGSGCSFQVLERSKGNNELLPGYTIFGDTAGMRVFSFPAGSTGKDIQERLDEWYRKNGKQISIKVDVEGTLDEELVLIVAEGVDSGQSVIILGGDAEGQRAVIRNSQPAAAPKQKQAPAAEPDGC